MEEPACVNDIGVNNKRKRRRTVKLRTPQDVLRLVQRIVDIAIHEGRELELMGRIGQLLLVWLKAWEVSKLEDLEKRVTELEKGR